MAQALCSPNSANRSRQRTQRCCRRRKHHYLASTRPRSTRSRSDIRGMCGRHCRSVQIPSKRRCWTLCMQRRQLAKRRMQGGHPSTDHRSCNVPDPIRYTRQLRNDASKTSGWRRCMLPRPSPRGLSPRATSPASWNLIRSFVCWCDSRVAIDVEGRDAREIRIWVSSVARGASRGDVQVARRRVGEHRVFGGVSGARR